MFNTPNSIYEDYYASIIELRHNFIIDVICNAVLEKQFIQHIFKELNKDRRTFIDVIFKYIIKNNVLGNNSKSILNNDLNNFKEALNLSNRNVKTLFINKIKALLINNKEQMSNNEI